MRLRHRGGAAGLLALLLPSCQCQEAASPDAATAPAAQLAKAAPAAAETALARQVCTLLQREPAQRRAACCGSGAERHLAAECEQVLTAALASGSVSIEASALQACAQASAEEERGCDWVTSSQPLPPAACHGLTRGRRRAGQPCGSSLECESPLHCAGATPSEPGQCAAPAEVGSPCAASSDALATYLFATDRERTHPSCAGHCSLLTRRCEPHAASSAFSREAPYEKALSGEVCQSDFDCARGGCNAGLCGMKCSVSVAAVPTAPPAASARLLAFRRRAER